MTHPTTTGGGTTGPGRNGSYDYSTTSGEMPGDRRERERYWRSLGKRIRKGAR